MQAPEMHAEATRRLEDACEAMARLNAFTATAPLQEAQNDDLTRSAVERQLSIVREALRVALLQDPSLRHSWLEVDAAMAWCDQLRDWEKPVEVQELAEFVVGDLKDWQKRMAELIGEAADEQAEAGSADCQESEEVGI
jgi:hypothetical protein